MAELREKRMKDSRALIEDKEMTHLLNRSLQYLKAGYPVHFTGPTGSGKTALALALAKKRKKPVMLIHGNHELDNKDLIGDFTGYTSKKVVDQYVRSVYKKDESVTENWRDGRLLEAVKNGYTLVYDEFTRSRPTTNNLFLSILEEGVLPLYGSKRTEPFVKVHPDFSVIFTSNPGEYAGVFNSPDALFDRMITLFVEYKSKEKEAAIVSEKLGMDLADAKAITSLVASLREQGTVDLNGPSLRSSLMIARIAMEEDIPIDGKSDEFQQLCIDILAYPLSQAATEEGITSSEASDRVIQACEKL